jgi:hypothetical protein
VDLARVVEVLADVGPGGEPRWSFEEMTRTLTRLVARFGDVASVCSSIAVFIAFQPVTLQAKQATVLDAVLVRAISLLCGRLVAPVAARPPARFVGGHDVSR